MIPLLADGADRELLARLPEEARACNGVPPAELADDRRRAVVLVADVLADVLHEGGVRSSPLGPPWSRDIDCHVTALPPAHRLEAAGWVCLDPLLHRLGHRGAGTWAVVDAGRVLAAADLHVSCPDAPVDVVHRRCRRRGEVRLREVLELRELHRLGVDLPDSDVVRAAADIEQGMGGDVLRTWRTGAGPVPTPPVRLRSAVAHQLRRRTAGPRRALRPRVVVALSGVDGAGKSSLAAELEHLLDRCGIPSGRVWTRPGMSVQLLKGVRRRIKAALGEGGSSGMQRRAAAPDARLATRSGAVGFMWSMVVCLSFLLDSRRQHLRRTGVVIHDRHVLDAHVTFDLVYGGTDLRVQKTLSSWLLPRADVAVYIAVNAEEAARRKPDDLFGVEALARQIAGYEDLLSEGRAAGTARLDGTTPSAQLARQVLALLLRPPTSTRRRIASAWRRSSTP